MNNKPDNSQISQRRRLLKGALAASSVATLSYGGAAAAASLGCIEKIATNGGGYPGAAYQFVEGDAPPAAVSGQGWAWEEVMVHEFQREASSAPTPSAVRLHEEQLRASLIMVYLENHYSEARCGKKPTVDQSKNSGRIE